jgi:hypothetical protein
VLGCIFDSLDLFLAAYPMVVVLLLLSFCTFLPDLEGFNASKVFNLHFSYESSS